MFARRFTIVSLLTILFGMVMATIVAEAGRERQWRVGAVVDCTDVMAPRCGR